jgi:hypothetical protein
VRGSFKLCCIENVLHVVDVVARVSKHCNSLALLGLTLCSIAIRMAWKQTSD